jgi:hypothetical protein
MLIDYTATRQKPVVFSDSYFDQDHPVNFATAQKTVLRLKTGNF